MSTTQQKSEKLINEYVLFVLLFTFIFFPFMTKAQNGDPTLTEVWEPVPSKVTPGADGKAPSDAVVLFDGKDLSKWKGNEGGEPKWQVNDDSFTVVAGSGIIQTKEEFGDIQLHIEWRSPKEVKGEGQGRGNSGIFLQGLYELQVLDSYESKTYSNGQAGSIYKQSIPLVNATIAPGEWQTYDVIYRAPIFDGDSLEVPATITVLHNGVLVQDHTEIKGTTEYIGAPRVIAHGKGALVLQEHGNPVSYRNIWLRELK